MFVRDLMTKSPAICTPGTKLDVAAKMMFDYDCGELPVCDGNSLVGVVTDRDIALRAVAAGMIPDRIAVQEVMTKGVHTVTADADVHEALQLMELRRVRRLPVTDRTGKVVGILSATDLASRIPPTQFVELVQLLANKKQRPVLVTV